MFIEELALNTHTRLNLMEKNDIFAFMKNASVIDVGCGTGFFSSLIVPHAKRLILLDISENNIKCANRLLLQKNIEFLISDCKSIELEDAETDIVFCTAVIEHLKDPSVTLREFHRILRPGGKLILTVDISSKITGALRNYLTRKAESRSKYDVTHPEVHKESVFSDDLNPKFFNVKKLKEYLANDFELLIEDYGGGILSNIIDSFLIFVNSLWNPKKLKDSVNISDHYFKFNSPLVRFYTKTLLPIIKMLVKFDNYKLDAFTVLLVFKKKLILIENA